VIINQRNFTGVAVVGAALCLVLLGLRLASAISFAGPLQLVTSGAEYESLFGIWKQTQGLPVYNDRFEAPYNAVMYNWALYKVYGTVSGMVLKTLSLGDAWLPTVGRLFSLLGVAVGTAAAYMAFAKALEARDGTLKILAGAFAVFVMAGPLMGFFSITVTSDIWALTLEVLAAVLFMTLYPGGRWRAVVVAAVLAYLAWSFKQTSIYTSGAIGLFLLLRRDWGPMFIFSGLMIGAWSATLLLGDPQYVFNILLGDYPLVYSIKRLARNLGNFAVKSGPSLFLLTALAVAVLPSRPRRQAMWRKDWVVFGLSGSLTTTLVSIPISSQSGGAENYYFSLSFFLSFLALAALSELLCPEGPAPNTALRPVMAAGALGWGTLIAALVLVLTGFTGVIDVRGQHTAYMGKKACIEGLPQPLFVYDSYLSLPWMTPGAEPYVLSYAYERDRARGKEFEHGGIGGLVGKRHFAAIIMRQGVSLDKLDGTTLAGYTAQARTCAGMTIFLRDDGN
jgi:hypothetical protein